jgi:hypothetical protein
MMKNTSRILLCAALLGSSVPAAAQELFKTPEEAASALVGAAKSDDDKAILAVLGPDGKAIVASGDPVADSNAREKFIAAYDAKHALELEGDGTQTLILGDDNWPFPIPLVNKAGEWQFDTKSGADEILRRRVGRNELSTIQVAEAYVQAQNEYAALDPAGLGRGVYARRFLSKPGKKDGLYWPTKAGETESPLGDIAAKASTEGYKFGGKPIPYHGYYYRILTRQGAGAPGGAYDYLVGNKLRGGFALIAYPSEYGNSGIMTFMVNHDGTVFEKDLGPETGRLAPKIEAFLPDSTWSKAAP